MVLLYNSDQILRPLDLLAKQLPSVGLHVAQRNLVKISNSASHHYCMLTSVGMESKDAKRIPKESEKPKEPILNSRSCWLRLRSCESDSGS